MRYLIKYRRGNSNNSISLTLDDGPSRYTPKFLQALDELDVKATFFVIPENVRALPVMAKDILARGHELGAHIAQPPGSSLPRSIFRMTDESAIDDSIETIEEICGVSVRFFRPSPRMAVSFGLEKALKQRQLIPVLASAYSRVNRPLNRQVRDIVNNLKGGDIILLHDGHDLLRESPRPETDLQVLKKVVAEARYRSLNFIKLSELLHEPPYRN